jgi:hypothetical protein
LPLRLRSPHPERHARRVGRCGLTCTGTPTAGASTTLGDDVEEATGSATNKKAKKGETKKGKAKKGKKGKGKKNKGKGKAKGNAEEWFKRAGQRTTSPDEQGKWWPRRSTMGVAGGAKMTQGMTQPA